MLGVARDVARAMNGYKVIVDKSTVPVGTAERVREVVRRETTHPFSVVSNPEFLKQGAAIDDFMKPDRVVIGAEDDRARELMLELYSPFTRTGAPIMVMDCASAELTKYAANAMLATRISFMNEVANVCERVGADVDHVRKAIGADRRIGTSFLFPGVGYGGSCFPKDVQAMVRFASDSDYDFRILRAVEAVNASAEDAPLRQDADALRHAEGQDARGLGPRVQAAHRRHARGAGDSAGRVAALGGRAGAGLRSRGEQGGEGDLRPARDVRGQQLRRAEGRRRAGDRDRVERVPPAGLRADARADAGAGHLRRAQSLRPGRDGAARVHLLFDRPFAHEMRRPDRTDVSAFRRLLEYARPYRLRLAGAVAAMVVYGAASAGVVYLITPILDEVLPTGDRLGTIAIALLGLYAGQGHRRVPVRRI